MRHRVAECNPDCLLGQAGSSCILFPTLHTLFSPPSQSWLISVPSQSQGVCGRVEKPNILGFCITLSLSLFMICKQSTTVPEQITQANSQCQMVLKGSLTKVRRQDVE